MYAIRSYYALAFWSTFIVWIYASVRFSLIWRETRNTVDGTMAIIAIWMLWATVSSHQFTTWELSYLVLNGDNKFVEKRIVITSYSIHYTKLYDISGDDQEALDTIC